MSTTTARIHQPNSGQQWQSRSNSRICKIVATAKHPTTAEKAVVYTPAGSPHMYWMLMPEFLQKFNKESK